MKRIRDVGKTQARIDPAWVAKQLGAERVPVHKWVDIKHKDPEAAKKVAEAASLKALEVHIVRRGTGILPTFAYEQRDPAQKIPVNFEFWDDGVVVSRLDSPSSPYGEGKTEEESLKDLGDSIGCVIRLLAPYARDNRLGRDPEQQWLLLTGLFDVDSYVGGYEDGDDD